ncbi:PAS domain-containing sensor histidine kinase [Ferruginibacter albus]|uniref:PAS domain-containing sensor histidine kinase n=1 Tax=Ferruginibacter albus TaxID=2875540 RepID=UPI001CC7476D|nr:PAS domain-containing protein [Ferruginibacter albus]UAY52788.1 PAS domain-containing protein [Ferruginibacter albus]
MAPGKEMLNNYVFLSGSGEMGKLTRSKDWSSTSVGSPDAWPQSLKTTLSIILNSKFPMFLWWGPELLCFYNDAYRPSLGQNGKHPNILGMPAHQAWTEIWDIIKPLIDIVLDGGEVPLNEDMLVPIYRNGKIEDVYWTFSYSPVHDENGKVGGVLVTCSETTEKVNLVNRFRNAISQAPIGIAIFIGPNFITEIANKFYLEIIDRSEEEFINKPLFTSLPEVKTSVEGLLNTVLNTGIPYFGKEFPVTINRYGKSELVYFDFTYQPYREMDGAITGVMVIAMDVTDSVKAKHAIAESEKQFRNMVMQSPIPMTIFRGEDHVIEIANKVLFETIWRKKEEDVMGKPVLQVFPELKEQKYAELLNTVYKTGIIHNEVEALVYVKGDDGMRKFYLDFEYRPLYEQDGSISGIMITVNDVTEKVEARLKAEELDEQKDFFIGIASHELKTPVTTIKGYVQLLQSMYGEGQDILLKDSLITIDRQVGNLTKLVTDLLDLSKIKSNDLYILKDNFDISEMVQEIIENTQQINPAYSITFSRSVKVIVHGDRDRLGQVLINFLTNAIKYSPSSKIINVEIGLLGSNVVVSVQDSGIGINQKDQEKIFERFYRVEGKNEKTFPGFGIGLFIAAEIIKKHNGTIGVTSEINKGSTFYFLLPTISG